MNTQEILTTQINEEVREEQHVVNCETADNEVVEATETTRKYTVAGSEAVEENKQAADDNLEEKIEAAVERKINEKLTTFEEKEDDDDISFDKDGIPSLAGNQNHIIEECANHIYEIMKPNEKICDICPDFEETLKKYIKIAFLSFDKKKRKRAIRFIESLEELNIIGAGHARSIRKQTKSTTSSMEQIKNTLKSPKKTVVVGPIITCGINELMMTMSEDEARKAIREQLEKQIPVNLKEQLDIESMIEQTMVVWRNSKEKYEAKTK